MLHYYYTKRFLKYNLGVFRSWKILVHQAIIKLGAALINLHFGQTESESTIFERILWISDMQLQKWVKRKNSLSRCTGRGGVLM